MRATDTFKNNIGDTYEVTCEYYDSMGTKGWRVWVALKPKGKRKFTSIGGSDDELRSKGIAYKDYDKCRMREYLKEIPKSWIESVMDDVIAEIRNLCCEVYPKYE